MCLGALFYDPVRKRIIVDIHGPTSSCTDDNALVKHPVMLMIQALADQQHNLCEKEDQYLATGKCIFNSYN